MCAVIARRFLLVVLALPLAACSSTEEKQWYKPGGNYTMAEFQRDETSCTKNRVLDEDCLKNLGWVQLTTDAYRGSPPMQGGGAPAKERYAPK